MGDIATHAIFYSAYWHLVFKEDGHWVSARGDGNICRVGDPEAVLPLER